MHNIESLKEDLGLAIIISTLRNYVTQFVNKRDRGGVQPTGRDREMRMLAAVSAG